MHYYLVLTTKCNLRCKYCYGKSIDDFITKEELKNYDLNIPAEITYNIEDLKNYLKDDPNPQITFYGGEPLLRIDRLSEIFDELHNNTEFKIQTNGLFLNRVRKDILKSLTTLLISIDGTNERTDERRGTGVYDKVISNIKYLRKLKITGEIIARLTIDETSNIYRDVTHLINLNLFDSYHWQIDAGFWKNDYYKRDFKNWIENNYKPNLKKLWNFWLENLKSGNLLKIYPFNILVYDLLKNNPSPMRCGAGHSCLGIQTDGTIVACPITAGYKPLYMGTIFTDNLKTIQKKRILPENFCTSCNIKTICGGRCLYWNKTDLWPKEGREMICNLIKFHINLIKNSLPEIKKLVEKEIYKEEDFLLEKYNGCEIIP